jgi:hypothetical protein
LRNFAPWRISPVAEARERYGHVIESDHHQCDHLPGWLVGDDLQSLCALRQLRHVKTIIPHAFGRGQSGEAQLITSSRIKTHCLAQAAKGRPGPSDLDAGA